MPSLYITKLQLVLQTGICIAKALLSSLEGKDGIWVTISNARTRRMYCELSSMSLKGLQIQSAFAMNQYSFAPEGSLHSCIHANESSGLSQMGQRLRSCDLKVFDLQQQMLLGQPGCTIRAFFLIDKLRNLGRCVDVLFCQALRIFCCFQAP